MHGVLNACGCESGKLLQRWRRRGSNAVQGAAPGGASGATSDVAVPHWPLLDPSRSLCDAQRLSSLSSPSTIPRLQLPEEHARRLRSATRSVIHRRYKSAPAPLATRGQFMIDITDCALAFVTRVTLNTGSSDIRKLQGMGATELEQRLQKAGASTLISMAYQAFFVADLVIDVQISVDHNSTFCCKSFFQASIADKPSSRETRALLYQ